MTPTVTGLRERKRGRVAVELDGMPWRVLSADVVVRAGITVGRRLDRPTARELAREVRRARALAQATRALAASGRSRRELEERLSRAGHSNSASKEALSTLERAGLLDDVSLAETRAEALARRGYGDAAIRADLRKRLIPAEAAAGAVAALEAEAERARRLCAVDTPRPALLRRLAGRGFSRDTIEEIAASLAQPG